LTTSQVVKLSAKAYKSRTAVFDCSDWLVRKTANLSRKEQTSNKHNTSIID